MASLAPVDEWRTRARSLTRRGVTLGRAAGRRTCPKGPLRRELAHRVEERPRPARLALERLREADQIARAAGVELDHAARRESVVRTDQAALRRLPVLRRCRQVDAEERALVRRARRLDRRRP